MNTVDDLVELRRELRAALDMRLGRANELQGAALATRSDLERANGLAQLMASHDASVRHLCAALAETDAAIRRATASPFGPLP